MLNAMKTKFLILLLVLFVSFVSCDDEDDSSRRVVFDQEEFQTNRAKWEQLNHQNFSYEYVSSGFFYSHLKIEIKNKEISSVSSLAEEGFQSGDTLTIDGFFEEIENRYPANGIVNINSNSGLYLKEIQVEYHELYYFPTEVHYLLHIPDAVEVDGNFDKYIRNFTLAP